MTNFTPSELKYVAETTMPAPDKTSWRVRENRRVTLYGDTCGWSFDFDPDTNAEQWKALAEWCVGNEITIHKGVSCLFDDDRPYYPRLAPKVGIESYHAHSNYSDVLSERVEAFNLVDCMIAAVLAHKQSSESGEIDCG